MHTMVKATVVGLGLVTSGTAMANNNFGGSPLYNPQYSYYGPHILTQVIRTGTITPGIRTIILVIITLMATLTMDGTREARTNIGIPRPHGTPIRRPILIGYPMSDGADRRSRPCGSATEYSRIAGPGAP